MQQPTIGRIVQYRLSEQDAAAINQRRSDFHAFTRQHAYAQEPGGPARTGHIAHTGNEVRAGEQYPAVIVRVWGGDLPLPASVNLKVLLDGNDDYWATSVQEGDSEHCWSWPARV